MIQNQGLTNSDIIIQRDDYRNLLIQRIREARHSLDVEVYIFEWDKWGQTVWDELNKAHERGIRVRLAIDGFGSRDLHNKVLEEKWSVPFEMRVYNPFPETAKIILRLLSIQIKWIARKNKRNHKKTFIFDQQYAIVGSRNIFDEALDWIEASIEVQTADVKYVSQSFEWSWERSLPIGAKTKHVKSQNRASELSGFYNNQQNVLINHSRSLKMQQRKILKSTFAKASGSIQIITPYFNPPRALLKILKNKAHNGVRIEIFLPLHSDLKVSQLLNRSFYPYLLKHGMDVYEVGQTILHAKVTVVDQIAIIGSSNYNYRSFRQDLELDFITSQSRTESLETLLNNFRTNGNKVSALTWRQKIELRLTRLMTFFIRRTI